MVDSIQIAILVTGLIRFFPTHDRARMNPQPFVTYRTQVMILGRGLKQIEVDSVSDTLSVLVVNSKVYAISVSCH